LVKLFTLLAVFDLVNKDLYIEHLLFTINGRIHCYLCWR